MAAHGQVLQLDEERVVHVRVDGEEWMQTFLQMRAVLQAELARVAGVRLGGIHFVKQ
jgi:predicted nucleic acid-binding Zn ribbon protein